MTPEQAEEVEALMSIFGGEVVQERDDGCDVILPYGESGGTATMSAKMSASYPATQPPGLTVSGLPRGQSEALLTHLALMASSHVGTPVLFELVSALRGWLGLDDVEEPEPVLAATTTTGDQAGDSSGGSITSTAAALCTIPIVHGVPSCGVCIDRKSVFQAHLALVRNREDVAAVLAALYAEPKVARATHNIQAWRFWHEPTQSWTCEGDDDGEDGAAKKLELVLKHMECKNVIVVVSRWYGGILLGPIRFHHINTMAKQLLEREGYGPGGAAGAAAGGGSGSGSKR